MIRLNKPPDDTAAGISMPDRLPTLYLARHGETAWTISGQHTGLTDIPLTPAGEDEGRRLGGVLRGLTFDRIWTSPLQRAARTCALAGFADVAVVDPDLLEWNYGDFDGKTSREIQQIRPGWVVFRDGAPGGESAADVTARADRVIARVRAVDGDTLLFSSGHFLRALAARWLGLDVGAGRFLLLGTASLSALSYDHDRTRPAIRFWNDRRHLAATSA
jgi:broad specificity phosphatase PhoE